MVTTRWFDEEEKKVKTVSTWTEPSDRRRQNMKYIEFDQSRPMDLVLLGRVAIDFTLHTNDQVKEEFKPLKRYICLKNS